jgi:hypothetical protein
MRGELLHVWGRMRDEVWAPLEALDDALSDEQRKLLNNHPLPEEYEGHPDLFAALFVEAFEAMKVELKTDAYGNDPDEPIRRAIDISQITSNPELAVEAFYNIDASYFSSEAALVRFLENVREVFAEYDEVLAARYQVLLTALVAKFNLRYFVESDGSITPTIPGVFGSVFEQLTAIGDTDEDVRAGLTDVAVAFRDLKVDRSESRIRTYVHRCMTLLELLAMRHPATTQNTLGAACKELNTWPHNTIMKSLSALYGFTSDYPGIRHAGNPASRLRDLDMRDMVAMTVLFSGYLPYLNEQINWNDMYLSEAGG